MTEPAAIPVALERYSRQIRFWPIGVAGQQRLSQSMALVVGCGALGSVIAETLARAGVGKLRLVDRDFPELHNLQRQVLYTEADVAAGIPKAIAAANHLRAINSQIEIDPVVADLDWRNVSSMANGVDVIVDGTDNFETRFLINDWSADSRTPWVYGGCLGSEGQTMTIVPGLTACLHCLMSDGPPPPGTTPGCDTAGIVAPIVNIIASLQASEALKLLTGNIEAINRSLTVVDLWSNRIRQMKLDGLAGRVGCPVCLEGERTWLSGKNSAQTAVLCGRNAVQIRGRSELQLDLADLARRLAGSGDVTVNEWLLRLDLPEHQLTVFPDGRAIITGTGDVAQARSLYARWIGS